MNDASDDEIIQALAMACQSYAARFGKEDLVVALENMIETILDGIDQPISAIPQ